MPAQTTTKTNEMKRLSTCTSNKRQCLEANMQKLQVGPEDREHAHMKDKKYAMAEVLTVSGKTRDTPCLIAVATVRWPPSRAMSIARPCTHGTASANQTLHVQKYMSCRCAGTLTMQRLHLFDTMHAQAPILCTCRCTSVCSMLASYLRG